MSTPTNKDLSGLSPEQQARAKRENGLPDEKSPEVQRPKRFGTIALSAIEGGGQPKEILTPSQVKAIEAVARQQGVDPTITDPSSVQRNPEQIALLNSLIGANGTIEPGNEADVVNVIMGLPEQKQ